MKIFFTGLFSLLILIHVPAKVTKAEQASATGAKEPPAIQAGEVSLRVDGLVCAFCAQGIRKKVSKLAFVDASKPQKGITLDENAGFIVVALKKGESLEWPKLFEAVKAAGYEVSEGWILLDGKPVLRRPAEKS